MLLLYNGLITSVIMTLNAVVE